DLNDLYRRIINRNNRLKDIIEIGAPDVMLHNEKRLLQESVDTLIQNGVRNKTVRGPGRRPLKSLSENIKGKQGRFRRNLLGKRVDYSGRSVIVVGPNLKLSQCGLPKEMALELYKPFVLRGLMKKGYAANAKAARRLLEQEVPVVYDILDPIIKDHPVLLNRAPTLHRLSIQAFEPVLVEGKAIQLHPLACAGFNADFDGDQMAVHVPISPEACMEAKLMVMAVNNIISPAHGDNIMAPSQDMVMGCNYITREKRGVKGDGMIFADTKEVEYSQQSGIVDINARIKVKGINKIQEKGLSKKDFRNPDKWEDYTTAGRVIFNQLFLDGSEFLNVEVTKKVLNQQVAKCFWQHSKYETVKFLDRIKKFGFKYATTSGISLSIDDMEIPEYKKAAIEEAEKKVDKILENFHKGYITAAEKSNGIIDIWSQVTDRVADAMIDEIEEQNKKSYDPGKPKFNPLQLMASSGARGSIDQIRQLAGMRGLMSRSGIGGSGEVIEQPIKSNFREGLSVFEYYISTHGGRKGLTDTALKTAEAGHLTRRLVDVAHNVIIVEEDCKTVRGINVSAIRDTETNEEIENLSDRIYGRVSLMPIADPVTDEIIVKEGELISRAMADKIVRSEITVIRVRSPITCESKNGICRKCYGADLSSGNLARVGMAVGVIAAQSIGEPGTQLTLRTFHVGGTASNISQAREIRAEIDGRVRYEDIETIQDQKGRKINISRKGKIEIKGKLDGEPHKDLYDVRYGAVLHKKAGKSGVKVKKGDMIAEWEPFSTPIIAEESGTVKYVDIVRGINAREEVNQKTGRAELVIVPYIGGAKGGKKNFYPHIELKTKKGKIKKYPLQIDALLTASKEAIEKGQKVKAGEELARVPLKEIKTRDITSGLPRVIELFESRPPKNSAVVTEIEGTVSIGQDTKHTSGALTVTISPPEKEGVSKTYKIPPGKHLEVIDGTQVEAGDALTDGTVDTHDILDIKGYRAVQEFLVNEIQSVYRLQGVDVNDKHIEIIIRQMLSFVQITASGDTTFQEKEVVKKTVIDQVNKELGPDKEPARYKPKLLGISKASLNSESFISAASFERTTKVLTQAAVSEQVDYLRGLKENVIVGKLIPVGTGQLKEES
ncbi:MAG: DNA-directed RNA polymerase subunit beta', partial [Elusimicrobiota bacterium]|nr:DNA-directed RNA polymerase subunit beta' [Elusimicrobiota bacterium]